MSSEAQGNQRRAPRFDTCGEMDARLAIMLDAKVLNVTAHGMCVELPFRPGIHSRHEFVVVIGERAIRAAGTVRSVRALTDELNAVGVEFDGLSWADRDAIERYIEGAQRDKAQPQ